VVKGYGGYVEPSTDQLPSLYDVRNRAIALQERDVPGAAELVDLASRLEYLQ
jgi:hypothetical protein